MREIQSKILTGTSFGLYDVFSDRVDIRLKSVDNPDPDHFSRSYYVLISFFIFDFLSLMTLLVCSKVGIDTFKWIYRFLPDSSRIFDLVSVICWHWERLTRNLLIVWLKLSSFSQLTKLLKKLGEWMFIQSDEFWYFTLIIKLIKPVLIG